MSRSVDGEGTGKGTSFKDAGRGAASQFLFLAFVLLLGLAAWFLPAGFAAARPAIAPLLGVVMLGMGLTLTPTDFRRVAERPWVVGLGVLLQFAIMPLAAWAVARAFGLGPEAAIGMILLGACPGGTASNVMAYLARGDVALSVSLTAVSTLLAPPATPLLTQALGGRVVDVPVAGLFLGVLKIVVGPVVAGLVLRRLFGDLVGKVLPALVPLTSFVIALIIAIIIGSVRPVLGAAMLPLIPAILLHNAIGLTGGYLGGRWLTGDVRIARTLALEVGMQNSGLAVALANSLFTAAAALPGALFSVWHNISGVALAAYWSGREAPAADESEGAGV